MTLEQITDVQAYNQIEPIGEYRADYRMAQVCLMLHHLIQMQRGDGKFTSATLQDFMLWGPERGEPVKPKRAQTVDEMKMILSSIPGVRKGKKG